MNELLQTGPIVVLLIRLLVPILILKWPLFGVLLSWLADIVDIFIIDLVFKNTFTIYNEVDKLLDHYFLIYMMVVAFKWENLEKKISMALFSYRTLGVILFEITHIRSLLFFFPNVFIFWWIFIAIRNRFFPKFKLTIKKSIVILVLLSIPKLIQEYVLHVSQYPIWELIKSLF